MSLNHKSTITISKRLIVEEVFNSITHGIGSLLSVFAIILLLLLPRKAVVGTIGLIIFGAVLLIAYTISTLYHSLKFTKANTVFKILDHAAIFLLIAGTYTGLITQVLNNKLGLIILVFVWIVSIWGIIQKSIWVNKWKKATLALYLGLGWAGILIAKPLIEVLPLRSVILLCMGGLFYTFGVIFYVWKKLPFSHMIWHLFVLLGSFCHFLSIYFA